MAVVPGEGSDGEAEDAPFDPAWPSTFPDLGEFDGLSAEGEITDLEALTASMARLQMSQTQIDAVAAQDFSLEHFITLLDSEIASVTAAGIVIGDEGVYFDESEPFPYPLYAKIVAEEPSLQWQQELRADACQRRHSYLYGILYTQHHAS